MATETQRSEESAVIDQNQAATNSEVVFDLEGMTCASCAMRIEKGLKKVPGVKDANVNLATERATVHYDPSLTGVEQMVQKVDSIGYTATLQQSIAENTAVPGVDILTAPVVATP